MIDTSFDPELYEAEAQAKREAKGREQGRLTPLKELLDLVVSKIPKDYQESPRMKRWVVAVGEDREGETRKERKRRLGYLRRELWGS